MTENERTCVEVLSHVCRRYSLLSLQNLDPNKTQQIPYSKTVWRSAISSLKSSDVVSFMVKLHPLHLRIGAIVHSKCRGSQWYICVLKFPLASTMFQWEKQCTCIMTLTNRWCEHLVCLLILFWLCQTLPNKKPKWLITHTIPRRTASKHFIARYGELFRRDLEDDTISWLYSLSHEHPSERNLRTKQKIVLSTFVTTTSWKKGIKAIRDFVENVIDADESNDERGDERDDERDDERNDESNDEGDGESLEVDEDQSDGNKEDERLDDGEVQVLNQIDEEKIAKNFRIFTEIEQRAKEHQYEPRKKRKRTLKQYDYE